MKENSSEEVVSYGIEELARLTGLTRRTIRYYIQIGLLPGPHGEKRGARYDASHLERLLKIRRLTAEHVPLEEIASELEGDFSKEEPTKLREKHVGQIEVRSHITLGDGIELVIDAKSAKLSAEDIRDIASEIVTLVKAKKEKRNSDD